MRLLSASILLATAMLGSAHADGDALEDMLGPREIAVGEAMRGGATGASAIGLNPAGLPLNRELVFEGGYGYRVSDQASLLGVSACDSTATMPGCFFYSYAGANPNLGAGMSIHRQTHIGGTSLGYSATPHILLGASLKYFHTSSDLMTEPSTSGFNWDIGATVRLTDLVNIGVAGYNLWGADSAQFPRAFGGGMLARPSPMLALSFDARWRLSGTDQTARYGGGAELFLRSSSGQNGYPIRIGLLHDNGLAATYLSGGLGLASMKFAVDITGRRAMSGPSETIFIASMRFFGPRQAAPALAPIDP
ncbi:MAG: hypothetical protein JWO36_5904 [Myxococcales bacterium]|nr:hypothetical protein [Myxococcales bacterium]